MTYFRSTSEGGVGFQMGPGHPYEMTKFGEHPFFRPRTALGQLPTAQPPVTISFSFRLANFAHLRTVWGRSRIRQVRREIAGRLADAVGEGALVRLFASDGIGAFLATPEALGGMPSEEACDAFVQSFCDTVSLIPIHVDGAARHVLLTGSWQLEPDRLMLVAEPTAPQMMMAANDGGSMAQYRADLTGTSELLELLSDNRLTLAWQPIRSAVSERDILYHEALAREVGAEGRGLGDRIPAAERLGFSQALDKYVVERVIDRLRVDDQAILGANISAQSAAPHRWWRDVIEALRQRPDVAQRLVIEITETTELPPVALAVTFANQMRALGCRIALDDFGAGHASFRTLLALQPAIVKIDAFFVQHAAASPAAGAMFRHLVGLAQSMTATVVVEGVETAEQADLAFSYGVEWQQGHYLGAPSTQ
jgi:EAL domain-containing protein (putative c-di-GMP-specific phosphodiesterase class I)